MRRTFACVCAISLLLALSGCRRSSPAAKKDAHLDAGYALLLTAPEKALAEFERSKDKKGAKEHALGQAYEALGQLEEAKAHYDRALVERPGFIGAETARARIDLLLGQTEPAAQRLARAVAKAPTELPALLLYAVVATSEEDRARALDALAAFPERAKQSKAPAEYFLALAALERDKSPTTPLTHRAEQARQAPVQSVTGGLVLARLALLARKPWLAQSLCQRIVAEKLASPEATNLAILAIGLDDVPLAKAAARSIQPFPETAQSQIVLGQIELVTGDPARALKFLKTGLALLPPGPGPNRDRAELVLAQAYLRQKDSENAALLADGLLARDPKNVHVQLLYSELELERGDAAAAVRRIESLLAERPKQPELLERLARARLAAGNADGAIEASRQRLAASPGDMAALGALVELLLSVERKADALRELETRVQASPSEEGPWILLAKTTEKAGTPAELRSVLVRYTAAVPKSENAWLSLARLEERENHADAVRRALDAALLAQPKSKAARQHLAEWSLRQEKWADAAAQYEELVKLAPNDENALNNLGYLYADRLNQAERAVEVAERAHKLAGARPVIEDTLGWALLRRGKPEDRARAVTLLRHAREFLHQDDVRLHLGVALQLSGDEEKKTEGRELLAGFRFRKGDPGHDFAQAVLAQGS